MADKNVLEAGEILMDDETDVALKEDLDKLAKDINVKESSISKVEALFAKLDSVDDAAKNRALQYALKNAKITVGNTEISIADISDAFYRATEQDWSTWRIKVKEWVTPDDNDLVGWFLNEKWSSLAYLIQLSSKHASLQASRWYWRSNADSVIDVGVDKIFWNQTRRALSWLKEWIEWDYTKDVESMDVKSFKVEDVLKLKFISKSLKEKIESEAEDQNVKNLWSNSGYELRSKYTNNYALKTMSVDNDKWSEWKEYEISVVWDKKVKDFTISSIDELPDGYKWQNPEEYDESKEDTYPKRFSIEIGGKSYIFCSNGRCATSDGMKNTKDVVESLKWWDLKKENEEKKHEEKTEDLTKFNSKVFWILKKDFKDVLQELDLREYYNTYGGGENPKLWVLLKTKEKYWWYHQTKWEWVNLHNFITEDWVLDKEKLKLTIKKMDDDYEKEVKLDNQEKIDEQNFLNEIIKNRYTFSDLFWSEKENIYFQTFFNEFSGWKMKLSSSPSTKFDGDVLKVELDKGWPNRPDWLRGHSIEKKDIKWQDGRYDVELFKQKLKDIVIKIVKENFEK